MREFTDKELYLGLEHAKSLDENAGRAILETFQVEQPVLAQTIFGAFPSIIAEQDQTMAHLFMDLVFDIICTFQHSAGALPTQQLMGLAWLYEKAALIEAEMTAMMSGKPHSDSYFQTNDQKGLVNFMNACIDEHVSENQASADVVRQTKTMIFVTVQLLCSIYDGANASNTIH
jgi:hypothetical protein